MEEKRKYKRLPIKLTLEVSSLFKQDNEIVPDIDAEIQVFDISKAGIGFKTKTNLPANYYFNAAIEFENAANKLLCVIKILHTIPLEDGLYRCGCEFVGMAPVFDYIFEEYEAKLADA